MILMATPFLKQMEKYRLRQESHFRNFSQGSSLKVVRVEDAGTDFFTQLDLLEISLGKEYTLTSVSSFDSSIQLQAEDGESFWLSLSMSSNIYAISL